MIQYIEHRFHFPFCRYATVGFIFVYVFAFLSLQTQERKKKKTPSHPIRITNDNEGNDSIIYILMQTLSIIHSPIRIIHEQIERNQMENLSNARIKMFSSRSSRIENVISFNFACLFILNRSV